jgi:hypothetical protein
MDEKKSIRNLNMGTERGRNSLSRDPMARERAPRKNNSLYLWVIGGIVLLVGAMVLALALLFPETKVTVTPQSATYPVANLTVTASRDRAVEGLHFDVVSLSAHDSITAPAQGTKKVTETASGTITVENVYSKDPVRLIKNTRFQSDKGKIYRIRESIVIPGFKEKDNLKTPGTLTVKVYADVPGDAYNVSEATFTVPGLKDKADMFAGITAKLTEPIKGGFSGDKPVVTDADQKAAETTLKQRLAEAVSQDIANKLPTGSVAFKSLTRYTYSDIAFSLDGNTATLAMDVTAEAVTFDEREFAKAIASNFNQTLAGFPAKIINVSALEAMADTNVVFGDTLNATINGSADLLWDIDEQKIANALVNASVADVQNRLAAFPEIKSAQVDLRPFWRSSFPASAEDIKIELAQ